MQERDYLHENSVIVRQSIVYLTYIYRISIVYLSFLTGENKGNKIAKWKLQNEEKSRKMRKNAIFWPKYLCI